MSTLLKQKQNMAKALEIRMEQESLEKYHVILAGMTVHKANCVGGNCEGNFMFTENMTYRVDSYASLSDATLAYQQVKEQYID